MMRRLGAAGASGGAGGSGCLSVMLLLNWLAFSAISLYQESRLPPNLREELHAEQEPMSAELLTALSASTHNFTSIGSPPDRWRWA
ncbi:MAG: hypothetical protein IPL51_05475 [Candidatus Competibacteraceae bacterium]|nr:hypothetical protein [Candidatus Competibacteraceae bacterium]